MKSKNEKKIVYYIVFAVIILACSYFGVDIYNDYESSNTNLNSYKDLEDDFQELSTNLKIHFIDVGQADAIIIEKDNEYVLVDAGTNSSVDVLQSYIDSQGIKSFKYVFGTHTHEDHIGGIAKVILKYDISNIVFPKTKATIKTFENFIDAVIEKKMKIITPKVGDIYELSDVKIQILAPNSVEYENSNNYSIVLKVIYNNVSYILTGDAEKLSEDEIMKNGLDISADVLKVGHHGATTSTSEEFLKKVNPRYAVISVGKNNSYSHPSDKILKRLELRNIIIYRTDINGNIVSITDGNNIKFVTER